MSLADPGLALVLDPARLSEVVGRDVRATHLRPKLGVSTAASLVDGDGVPWGWVRTLTGDAVAKAAKTRARAAELGLAGRLGQAELAGRATVVQWGPLVTDPRLARPLARLDLTEVDVLRHNPLRRLVGRVRGDGLVVRVTAHAHRDRLTGLVGALAAAGVPVLTPAPDVPAHLPRGRGVTWWPWVEGADASSLVRDPDAGHEPTLAEVGRLAAHLHGVDPSRSPVLAGLPTRGWADLRAGAAASVELLEAVSPGTAGSARRVLDRLPVELPGGSGPLVVCHGDLSLDQVLVRTGGGAVLTDFDRAALAPAVLDHATLAAVELVEGREGLGAVASGYADVAGLAPHAPGPWVAAVLLTRILEPWRQQVHGWSGETVRRALLAAQALEREDVWAPAELAGTA